MTKGISFISTWYCIKLEHWNNVHLVFQSAIFSKIQISWFFGRIFLFLVSSFLFRLTHIFVANYCSPSFSAFVVSAKEKKICVNSFSHIFSIPCNKHLVDIKVMPNYKRMYCTLIFKGIASNKKLIGKSHRIRSKT